ncbi:hypothetical protein [Rhodoferax sp.]|uniref:hypothetical protein n=1 Tax=Rhodoferax sp. TaxID=50421 RepID=UPI002776E0CF|nr:hypothetical protein [Rhodoferax sp.]
MKTPFFTAKIEPGDQQLLERYAAGQPVVVGSVLLGGGPEPLDGKTKAFTQRFARSS